MEVTPHETENCIKINLEDINTLLEPNRANQVYKHPWATVEDYVKANNSTGLEVLQNQRGLYYVVHGGLGYNKEDIVVPTHDFKSSGIINIEGFSGVDFITALLWQFHGKPCETRSIVNGGTPYRRTT